MVYRALILAMLLVSCEQMTEDKFIREEVRACEKGCTEQGFTGHASQYVWGLFTCTCTDHQYRMLLFQSRYYQQ